MTKVLSPRDLRCPDSGKTAFVSRRRAKAKKGAVPVRCGACGWWHRRD